MQINLEKCAHPLSIMHIYGEINDHSDITYISSGGKGMVACIQLIENGYLMEFNTSGCMEMDYCRNIIDVRFMAADIPFKFSYAKGATLRRIDIFFPVDDISQLLDQSLVSLLERKGHFVVDRKELKSMSKKIETILKDTDNHSSQTSICGQAEKLVQLMKSML